MENGKEKPIPPFLARTTGCVGTSNHRAATEIPLGHEQVERILAEPRFREGLARRRADRAPAAPSDPYVSGDDLRAWYLRCDGARRLAMKWSCGLRLNDRGLAERLGEDVDVVMGFLDRPTEPSGRTSRAAVGLVRRIERVCCDPNYVTEAPIDPKRAKDDEQRWNWDHMLGLREIRKELEPLEGLDQMAAACAQAIHGPSAYRAAMCTNVLLSLMCLASSEAARECPRALLAATLERVFLVEATLVQSVPRLESRQRGMGYAAKTRISLGRLLGDDSLVEGGVQGMTRVAHLAPQRNADGLWPNLLLAVESLLETGHAGSARFLRQALSAARSDIESAREALGIRDLPRIVHGWKRIDRELAMRLIGGTVS